MLPLTYLIQRTQDDWLVGQSSVELFELTQQVLQQLEGQFPSREHNRAAQPDSIPRILIAEQNPVRFLAYFIAACTTNSHVFLANPNWVSAEWQQVFELVQPNLILGNATSATRNSEGSAAHKVTHPQSHTSTKPKTTPYPSPLILLPTGGTSGNIRFAMHTWETLMASVDGFRQHFNRQQVNSFCVLPLYHVSGLMQCLRSLTSGGKLALFPFKAITPAGNCEAPEAGERGDLNPAEFFLSLVPTQLQRLLARSEHAAWLSRFHTVLLGGAPAWAELLEQARAHRIRLALTYGMTETASQIATLKPEDFLSGDNSCGPLLPHAHISRVSSTGKPLSSDQPGPLVIQSQSLALGYYPNLFGRSSFQTDDVGYLDDRGYLNILRRGSDKIITGGENVFPIEVEAAIRATGLVEDVCVIGVDDRHWGQAVSAVYIPANPQTSAATLRTALEMSLSKFKQPKHWIAVEQLPRNAQGKVQRPQVVTLVQEFLVRSTAAAIE